MSKTVASILIMAISLLLASCGSSDDSITSSKAASDKAASDKLIKTWSGDQYEREYSPSFGPDNAKVTIVEFFDPACEACRAFYPFVKEILKRHPEDVRLVLRYAAFHQGSEEVIRLLEIAKQQGHYEAVLDALLVYQKEWASHHSPNLDKAWEIAKKAGMDIDSAKVQLYSPTMNSLIKQENEDIRSLQIRQTPTFFVNKKGLEEFGGQQLYNLVVAELEK